VAFPVVRYGVRFVVSPAFMVQHEHGGRHRKGGVMGTLLRLHQLLRRLRGDDSGQDMIEYALLAAALVLIVAGFLPPSLMPAVDTIFSKITSSLAIS
jgi:Flp pilus assembly pilin Flp